jgi:hypothetical protein
MMIAADESLNQIPTTDQHPASLPGDGLALYFQTLHVLCRLESLSRSTCDHQVS